MQHQEHHMHISFNKLKYKLENRVGNVVPLTWTANPEKVAELHLQTSVQILVIWVTVNQIRYYQIKL